MEEIGEGTYNSFLKDLVRSDIPRLGVVGIESSFPCKIDEKSSNVLSVLTCPVPIWLCSVSHHAL